MKKTNIYPGKSLSQFLIMLLLILAAGVNTGCKKFLETKSVQNLATPENLEQLQGLLDNPIMTNGPLANNTSTDEYYIGYTQYLSRPEKTRRTYVWDATLEQDAEWTNLYSAVYYANNVLFNLDFVSGTDQQKNHIRGQALFFRAHAFFQLLELYAKQYDPATAGSDMGIVLRLDADFNKPSVRSSVEQCYQQVIQDLQRAADLLPTTVAYKFRPNKPACLGLLARVFLQKGDYTQALSYARQSQGLYNTLINYNTIATPYPTLPMPNLANNVEVLFYFRAEVPLNADYTRGARTDSVLMTTYAAQDIRRTLFFIKNADNSYSYRGVYTAESRVLFTGVATDEILLISAECEARLNNANAALADLNKLLVNRYTTGNFVPYQNLNATQALDLVLLERRKQLINRGLRWSDLRRLNRSNQYAITLKRVLNGVTYQLPANDLRYVFLIPVSVINLTGMPQNPR